MILNNSNYYILEDLNACPSQLLTHKLQRNQTLRRNLNFLSFVFELNLTDTDLLSCMLKLVILVHDYDPYLEIPITLPHVNREILFYTSISIT